MCADRDYSQDSSCLSVPDQDSTSEYSASEYSASEYSAGLSAPGQLIDAEDSHLLIGNTYPVKSQLASSKMVSSQLVTANSKPKITRKGGVWICRGDGLSVAGGDIQRVYRGWCDWVLARGRGLSL